MSPHVAAPRPTRSGKETPAVNQKARTRLIVVTVAILGLVGVLIYTSAGSGTLEYKTPTEVNKAAAKFTGKSIRMTGEVATGTVLRVPEGLKFDVTDRTQSVPVLYTGIVPDTFKEGLQVVVDGTYADGRLTSKSMVTKCPTKFKEQLPAKPAGGK